jgi:hypothetical protein
MDADLLSAFARFSIATPAELSQELSGLLMIGRIFGDEPGALEGP